MVREPALHVRYLFLTFPLLLAPFKVSTSNSGSCSSQVAPIDRYGVHAAAPMHCRAAARSNSRTNSASMQMQHPRQHAARNASSVKMSRPRVSAGEYTVVRTATTSSSVQVLGCPQRKLGHSCRNRCDAPRDAHFSGGAAFAPVADSSPPFCAEADGGRAERAAAAALWRSSISATERSTTREEASSLRALGDDAAATASAASGAIVAAGAPALST